VLQDFIFRTHFMAVALLLAGQFLHADDKVSDSDGSKQVPIKVGGKTTYIKVQQQPELSQHRNWSTSPDKYNPMAFDLGRTSSLANKHFDAKDTSFAQSNHSFQQQAFPTKSYSIDDKSRSNLNPDTKASTHTTTVYDRNASGFDKSFATTSSDAVENKNALFAANASDYQGRTAVVGSQQINTSIAFPLANKSYQGPEADSTRHDLDEVNNGLSRMSGLPNRPLTIDEVRNLINHDAKPDTNSKPAPASKPLNDPDYKPVPSPAPPAVDDGNSDLAPSPGMAAASAAPQPPENSEPLPR
jgi:hypothetical protein